MKVTKTERGFEIIEFDDRYKVKCSLQQSSLAESGQPGSSAVWFGPDDANPKICIPGEGWKPVPFPENTLFNTRAHLDRKMVKQLVVYLHNWLESGSFKKPQMSKKKF